MEALKIITLFLFTVAGKTFSQNSSTKCPFQFLYHFGDGISDIGNSVRILPFGPRLPPTRYPYGVTFPSHPTGRWSDGFVDVDYVAQGVSLPNIKPYQLLGSSKSYDGVIFSVEGSTVLSNSFFKSKGIIVPPYNIPLSTQFNWFTTYLRSVCTNQTECGKRKLPNSVVLLEFSESNDLGYALVQGRSIQEVTTYVPLLVQAQANAAREVIKLGSTRFVYTTAAPLGCYPYILTALSSNDSTAYDELGCLKAVNSLTVKLNADLLTAINGLQLEFPNVTILPADYYSVVRGLIREKISLALKSCCGIGGRYNYDSKRFCGNPNVPVCPNPKDYVFWDGLHFTHEAYRRIIHALIGPALLALKCRFKPEEISNIEKDFDEPPTGLFLGGAKYMVIQGSTISVLAVVYIQEASTLKSMELLCITSTLPFGSSIVI